MKVLPIELYLFILLSVTLNMFQDTQQYQAVLTENNYDLIRLTWNFVWL